MMAHQLTKEQQVLLDFYSRIPRGQRTIALRIIEEMAKASGHDPKADNAEPPSEFTIYMEGERARKFNTLLADIYDCNIGLMSMASLFPNVPTSYGEANAAFTVRAVCKDLEDRMSIAMSMVNGDDLKQQETSHV